MPRFPGRTDQKILRGVRPSRINAREPKPELGAPPKPRHLGGVAAAEWRRLVGLTLGTRVLTLVDGPILEATVMAYAEYRQGFDVIQRDGATYETTSREGSVMRRIRPEVAIAASAWRRYVHGLTHFGLSPATRSKVAEAREPEERGRLARFTASGKGKKDPR